MDSAAGTLHNSTTPAAALSTGDPIVLLAAVSDLIADALRRWRGGRRRVVATAELRRTHHAPQS